MKKKCYIYMRVSTAVQIQGYSLEAQEERLKEYAEYRDLVIAGSYCDAGKSGKSIKGRPEFQKMMDDIMGQKDDVSFVLVYKLSRFGRNAADVLRSMQILSDFDVDLVCVEDAIDSSTQGGRFTMSILSAVAEIERENIAVQFMSGKLQSVKNGGWYGGVVPYGYRTGPDGLIVDPEEARIVRLIFDLYLQEDMTIASVTNWMNDHESRTGTGGKEMPFSTCFVGGILKNPVRCGKLRKELLQRHGIDPDTDFGKEYFEGKQEAIVSEEQWIHAQEKMRLLSRKSERVTDPDRISLLSGLVKCPICGTGMISCKSKRLNPNHGGCYKIVYEYKCRRNRKAEGRQCKFNLQYNQERVDAAVLEILGGLTETKTFRREVIRQMGSREDGARIKEQIEEQRRCIRTLNIRKELLAEELDTLDIFDDDYDSRYEKVQMEMDSLYDDIAEREEELRTFRKRSEELEKGISGGDMAVKMLDHLLELYEHMTCEEKREMFRLLIDRIEVYPEHQSRIIRSISFNIPVYYEDVEVTPGKERTPDDRIVFTLDCSDVRLTKAEAKATYAQITAYIHEKYGAKVTNLYIAQIKRKYGLDMRKNYNIKKDPNARTVQCPPAKEAMIVEALQHFRMLEPDAKPAGEEGTDEA